MSAQNLDICWGRNGLSATENIEAGTCFGKTQWLWKEQEDGVGKSTHTPA